jgi:ActR/RegA family two-component response regulator
MLGQARLLDARNLPAKAERLAPPRVLVIDGDNLHRMIMCRAADKAGYIPAGAATCEEAVKLARTAVFDCITLDLSIGPLAAGETLRRLRALDCEAQILIVGGANDAACREMVRMAKSLRLNVGEPVAKPVDVGRLRYALEQMKIQGTLQRALAAVGA